MVEKPADLRIDSPVDVPRPTLLSPLVQRLMGTVALPEALGEGMKIRFQDRLQAHHHRPLDTLVLNAGLASWPLLPPFLLDPYPFDRWRDVPIVAQPLMQVPEVVVQLLGVLRGRHLIYPRCTRRAGQPMVFQKAGLVDQVQYVV